ncbi:MAG: hypothetical protein ACXW25_04450 [Rhodospirillales bacterium]|nr:hypothetical protein [Rhodospirillales bacterium]
MLSLHEINRVVYRHGWGSLSEWAEGIDRLADLSDAELEALADLAPAGEAEAARR